MNQQQANDALRRNSTVSNGLIPGASYANLLTQKPAKQVFQAPIDSVSMKTQSPINDHLIATQISALLQLQQSRAIKTHNSGSISNHSNTNDVEWEP